MGWGHHTATMARHFLSRGVDAHHDEAKVYELKVLTPITADRANAAASGTFISLEDGENALPLPTPSAEGTDLKLATLQQSLNALQRRLAASQVDFQQRLAASQVDFQQRLAASERRRAASEVDSQKRLAAAQVDFQRRLTASERRRTASEVDLQRRLVHLQRSLASIQQRTSSIERRLVHMTVVNTSRGILALLAHGDAYLADAARSMAQLPTHAFADRMPRGFMRRGADIARVQAQFAALVHFTLGNHSRRNRSVHPNNWAEFYAWHGRNIIDLMGTAAWQEPRLRAITSFIGRVALFAQRQNDELIR